MCRQIFVEAASSRSQTIADAQIFKQKIAARTRELIESPSQSLINRILAIGF
jgi:hypothetical protein